ncbi:hypothetical protein C9374_010569 [Naegleria lovaniensis]|uniref:Uncharacterized protein n=1 Tax=Naegleria lovaniensis TaxID=51637 RepID=A0AA88GB91_NAELO|nr:uncharacterized protein C9374_010569 [Naegleria lovaniensis]KAG2374550.1 hypothetical protein C9374_010569 [Naegleria lovaniensis]
MSLSDDSQEETSSNSSRIIFVASPKNGSLSEGNQSLNQTLEIFSFLHPKYKQQVKFGLLTIQSKTDDDSKTILLEMERIGDKISSWFIGNNVISDGRPIVLTPMDVTFLLIAILESEETEGESFKNMMDVIPPVIQRVSSVRDMIVNICQVVEVGDDLFVQLSPEKVNQWMIAKCDHIFDQINNNNELKNKIITSQGSFKRSLKNKDAADDRKIRAESIRFLSEYMDRKWIEILASHFDLLTEIYPSKNASMSNNNSQLSSSSQPKSPKPSSQHSQETDDFLADLDAVEKNKRKRAEATAEKSKKTKSQESRNVQSLKKVNTKGMKSMDSFFKKKQ